MFTEELKLELELFERQGITIWLENSISDPTRVSNAIQVCEDAGYMRDYIFDRGVLKELRFDKVYD